MTRQGRTLAAIPRSVIQTEPRSARGMAGLFDVQCSEEFVGSLDQCGLGQVPLDRHQHPAKDLDGRLVLVGFGECVEGVQELDRKSTRLNSSHVSISYAVFCLKK